MPSPPRSASDASNMDSKAFILMNVPEPYWQKDLSIGEELIINYIEGTIQCDVEEVKLHPHIPGIALVVTKEEIKNISDAAKVVHNTPLESYNMSVVETNRETAVVVDDLDVYKLSDEFACLYFESAFAEGRKVIESFHCWPKLKLAIFKFHSGHNKVVKRILNCNKCEPLPSEGYQISVHPFNHYFHDFIQLNLNGECTPNSDIRSVGKMLVNQREKNDSSSKMENMHNKVHLASCQLWRRGNKQMEAAHKIKVNENSEEEDQDVENDLSERRLSDVANVLQGRGRRANYFVRVGTYQSRGRNNNQCSGDTSRSFDDLTEVNTFSSLPSISSNCNVRGRSGSTYTVAQKNKSGKYSSDNDHKVDERRHQNAERANNVLYQANRETEYTKNSLMPMYIEREDYSYHKKQLSDNSSDEEKRKRLEQEKEFQLKFAAKEEELKKIREENVRLREKPEQFSEKLDIKVWQAELLSHCFGQSDDCIVRHVPQENAVIFEGPKEKVTKLQLEFLQELRKVKEEEVELSQEMCLLLVTQKGKIYLSNLNTSLKGARLFIQDKTLIVAAQENQTLQETLAMVRVKLLYREKMESQAKVPKEKMELLHVKLEYELLVKISWCEKKNTSEICIEGIRDDVQMAKRDVENLFQDFGVSENIFSVLAQEAMYFFKYFQDKVTDLLKEVDPSDLVSTANQFSVKFTGEKNKVNQVHRKLTELKTNLRSRTWDITLEFKNEEDLMLIAKGFTSPYIKDKLDIFEIKNKCLVIPSLPDISSVMVGSSKQGKPRKQRIVHEGKLHRPERELKQMETSEKLMFSVSPSCQLVINAYGDITRENSDILVCVLAPSLDLRKTRVGLAFNKTCPSLWQNLKAESEKNQTAAVLTTIGPFQELKCKAVCHVVLSPWDPVTSPAQLDNAVKAVLLQAVALGVKTVSFPALGHGRAFKFPAVHVAQIMLSCIKSSKIGDQLSKITLLAPDSELFQTLKHEAGKNFPSKILEAVSNHTAANSFSFPSKVQGAISSASFINSHEAASSMSNNTDEGPDESDDTDNEEETLKIDFSSQPNKPDISIITFDKCADSLWILLKNEIIKLCLHVDYFNQESMDHWPKEMRQNFLQEAEKLCVWIKTSPNPKNNKPGYLIKGEKEAVYKMKDFIHKEFLDISHSMPKSRIVSSKMPKRGTVEFMKHAASSDELFPSYWSLNRSVSYWKKVQNKVQSKFSSRKTNENFLVDVDSATSSAIEKLVFATWDQHLVGQGNDAVGLDHKAIKVVKVQRVENVGLFELYKVKRKQLFERMCEDNHVCHDIGRLRGSKRRVTTTEALPEFMKKELYYEINEHYLFHGTKKDNIAALAKNGVDPRVSSENAMFGKGFYTAERFTKSDQYTDSRNKRHPRGSELTMILSRVLLGNVFVCDDRHKSIVTRGVKLTRPPCMHCQEDKCSCKNQKLFDSVMGDGKWLFREFVVYDRSDCYPEYVITYKRV